MVLDELSSSIIHQMKAATVRLENRLEKCFNKQNLTEAGNKQLKLNIDDLRYEKVQIARANARAERELKAKRAQLKHTLHETNALTDHKDAIKKEMEALKSQTMNEIEDFTETFESLSTGLHDAMDTNTRRARMANGSLSLTDGAAAGGKASPRAGRSGDGGNPEEMSATGGHSPIAAKKKEAADAAAQERKKLDMDEMRDETMKAYWVVQKRQARSSFALDVISFDGAFAGFGSPARARLTILSEREGACLSCSVEWARRRPSTHPNGQPV